MAIDPELPFAPVSIALLTVSDTRTEADDTSGDILAARIADAGHALAARTIVPDSVQAIAAQLDRWIDDADIDVIVTTGGTGFSDRDVTPEALARVREGSYGRDIEGFGELFRQLSYRTIGTSTIQSRACAIAAHGTFVFALPGSNGAVKDGWDMILAEQLDSRNRPCNFVQQMPRFKGN
ncbi:molybdenum cofactor biosynthesis protein B [Pelagerythrobacter sp.]|uniref:molybdenum cofactor biosynthesis protein B n=1 Tax=Pelagerythrobacter sp. TaxID=2800702 RepID=UPI0035AF211B